MLSETGGTAGIFTCAFTAGEADGRSSGADGTHLIYGYDRADSSDGADSSGKADDSNGADRHSERQ